ncbi:MAG TPA: GGDEF domain-containing protein [Rhodopila sp.]|nr:GGDEF domain-containing protein [Rhodopila sp.]
MNDRYGHDTGDQVLIGTVQACRQALRADDPIIRMGGEEFLVLLAGIAVEEVTVVAERVRTAIAATVMLPGVSSLRITVSIGVAACSTGDESYGEVVRRADTALYRAKRNGRDRVSAGSTGRRCFPEPRPTEAALRPTCDEFDIPTPALVMARRVRATYSSMRRDRWPGRAGP